MSWEQLFAEILNSFFMPPGINLILILTGWILLKRYRKTAVSLFSLSLITLYIFSLPIVADSLIQRIESTSALTTQQIKQISQSDISNKAIVVLSGGRVAAAPEYDKIDIVNPATLQRIHFASWLQKRTQLPVLLSGGSSSNEATAESVLMNQLMAASFGNQPRWIESESKNTGQSAEYSANILKKNDIDEVILVTHAWHMPKASKAFESNGLKVVEAPTAFLSGQILSDNWRDYFPSADALAQSNKAFFEMFVSLWLELRY
ncbi:YdcF family protein [Aliikangiella marina]|uniref:YdcF family protein n=1 Tax=Aliikangiella marina TaxID=1712262 RepID=A0A545TBS4_9GAMM|nr:YdcF family protein [Aliikangiella marina]TQV74651.1 YdcF family protein [Aliikangiella marina]